MKLNELLNEAKQPSNKVFILPFMKAIKNKMGVKSSHEHRNGFIRAVKDGVTMDAMYKSSVQGDWNSPDIVHRVVFWDGEHASKKFDVLTDPTSADEIFKAWNDVIEKNKQ
jgi:hypothetical protein